MKYYNLRFTWQIVVVMLLYGAFLSYGLHHQGHDWAFIWWVWGPGCALMPFWIYWCMERGNKLRRERANAKTDA
jgi:hypothetical protein